MLGRTLLFSGGRINLSFAAEYLKGQVFDSVVCADSGLHAAYQLKMPVSFFLGDFDSVNPEVLKYYQSGEQQAKWMQYPAAKDYTDTHMVIEWILAQGAEDIVILGATGGRMDHFLSNVHSLVPALKQGVDAYLVDENNRIRLLDHDCVIEREELYGKYISLLPLTETVTGLTLTGMAYPVEDFSLEMGNPRAISNELAEGESRGRIEMRSGIVILVESRD